MRNELGDNKTIYEQTVEEGGTLILAFFSNTRKASFTNGDARVAEFELAFFEVQGANRVNYRNLDLRDSTGSTVTPLGPEAGQGFQRIHDDEGEDIFRIETNESPWQITHTSVSVLQDNVWVYPRIPETNAHPGWTWAVGDEPNPANGDQFGFTAGAEMDYDEPPASLQSIAFESGDRSTIQYGFFNDSQHRDALPRMNVEGKTYRVSPITSTDKQTDAMQSALGDYPNAKFLTFGPITDNFTISLPDEWKDVGATVNHIGPLSQFGATSGADGGQ